MSYTSKTVEKRGDTKNSSARLVFVALAILVQIFWIMYLFITLNDNYKITMDNIDTSFSTYGSSILYNGKIFRDN